jgi:hypothetical protein
MALATMQKAGLDAIEPGVHGRILRPWPRWRG